MERSTSLEFLQSTLSECLVQWVSSLSSQGSSDEGRLEAVRQLCAVVYQGRFVFRRAGIDLLARLRAHPIVMPVLGGHAEFSFDFWRDLQTIALGGWEPAIFQLLPRVLREGAHVVDIGAHVGHFTIQAAHIAGPSGRVIAAEPAPRNFVTLLRNLAHNGLETVVQPVQVAIADHEGRADFFDDGGTAGTEYSLYPDRHGERGVAFTATLITLDSLVERQHLARVDLVKIDAEGAELAILLGATATLARDEVTFLIELHPWTTDPERVCERLQREGFRLYAVDEYLTPLVTANRVAVLRDHSNNLLATRRAMPHSG